MRLRFGTAEAKQKDQRHRKVDMSPIDLTAQHEVRFGSTVSFTDQSAGREQTFTIVASHGASAAEGRLSAASPIARALLGHRVGDLVGVRTPKGIRPLLIAAIA